MALISCPECENEVSDQADVCPECGYPIEESTGPAAKDMRGFMDDEDEKVLLRLNPKMFRQAPLTFLLYLLLPMLAFGLIPLQQFRPALFPDVSFLWSLYIFLPLTVLLLVPLFIWWLRTKARTLVVTNKKSRLRTGILSKDVSEVYHSHVRNVKINQNFFQRLLGVGDVRISSAGQSGIEIQINGIYRPDRVNEVIDDYL